tara:strand:- start:1634 stop:2407 length:774 start_codon:yes stop_codon:yes gene_type:complete
MNEKYLKDGTVKLWDGGEDIIYIALNNPPVNALSNQVVDELQDALSYIEKNKKYKALQIGGVGGIFSAGADLKERSKMSDSDTILFIDKLNDCFDIIENLEIPTVANISGAALGGGAELALCCDFIAVYHDLKYKKEPKIGFPETTIGIIPGAGGTYRIFKKMNSSTAKRWILSGKAFSFQEAIEDGFVDFDSSQLSEFYDYLRANSRTSLVAAKASMNKCYLETDRKKQRLIELEEYKKTLNSPDRKEALKKYKKK